MIVRIHGGLGNQLFQYACAYSLSQKNNGKIILEVSDYDYRSWPKLLITQLNIDFYAIIRFKQKRGYFDHLFLNLIRQKIRVGFFRKWVREGQGALVYDASVLDQPDSIYLIGYFQNERYFKSNINVLRNFFSPRYTLDNVVENVLKSVKHSESAAVHIRRGDYVKIGCIASDFYYLEAIKILKKSLKNIVLYVFSDDLEYAKSLLSDQTNCVYVDLPTMTKDLDEFIIMKNCKHQIISNSTFSWWAAYLNDYTDKKVIAPRIRSWDLGFYPEDWNLIDA